MFGFGGGFRTSSKNGSTLPSYSEKRWSACLLNLSRQANQRLHPTPLRFAARVKRVPLGRLSVKPSQVQVVMQI